MKIMKKKVTEKIVEFRGFSLSLACFLPCNGKGSTPVNVQSALNFSPLFICVIPIIMHVSSTTLYTLSASFLDCNLKSPKLASKFDFDSLAHKVTFRLVILYACNSNELACESAVNIHES